MKSATAKCGGAYVYSNQQGCDGNRMYFDGCSLIYVNGELVAQGSQFSVTDIEVVTAVIDLNDIRTYRNATASLQEQSSSTGSRIHRIDLKHFRLGMNGSEEINNNVSLPIRARIHSPEEECALGPACWLWDYIRRSGASGLLLPLSGGADSASVAGIVRVMCKLVATAVTNGDQRVIDDIKRITNIEIPEFNLSLLHDSTSISNNNDMILSLGDKYCNSILHTVYMGTSNSSIATNSRAARLSKSIGAYHNFLNIDLIVSSILTVFSTISGGKLPKYISKGGSHCEDLALQNIQARLRMVMAYLCAQLLPWCRGKTGFLLVLGSANVDEALRGYMTKYDCSSADINPIGGISKGDLKRMLGWIAINYKLPVLAEISEATPTAELRPIDDDEQNDYTQTDEDDMGMSYEDLGIFGILRKVYRCGPVTMFQKLIEKWGKQLDPSEIAVKVKRFFFYYSINRHKMTTLTPSYHAENYSPDDNRFDLRQFLYNSKWSRQYNTIDAIVKERENRSN